MVENVQTEFKMEYTDEIKRTVVAFANGIGGKIYIGVDDSGKAVGVKDLDEVMLKVSSSVKNAIKPDVSLFTQIENVTIEGKAVVVVNVQSGTKKPYYIAEKGLKPNGVLVRFGSATVSATEDAIRQLIKLSDGDKFETALSVKQDLTFESADKTFESSGVKFGEKEKRTLGLIRESGEYTNLALLISDQCKHSIKVAMFEGDTKSIFRDRREFGGSLFSQIEKVYEYIDLHNKTNSVFEGLKRIDMRDFPERAIREALLNAIVHREYSLSGSVLVNIYDNRMEIVSIGGIVEGISMDAITNGISQPRNEKLANIFYRLKFIEAYGTGIPRIMTMYAQNAEKPEIFATDSSFSITLPKVSNVKTKDILSDGEKMVYDVLEKIGATKMEDISSLLKNDIGKTTCYNILDTLCKKDIVEKSKMGRAFIYNLK